MDSQGFPSGLVAKNLPANAGDTGLIPGWGRSHMLQTNYWAYALEPVSHNSWSLWALSLCSATRKATTMRSPHTTPENSPRLLQLEEARTQQWRPRAVKSNQFF